MPIYIEVIYGPALCLKRLNGNQTSIYKRFMNLKKIFLFISFIIIGLILSVYFQTEKKYLNFHPHHYQRLTYDEERSHSLKDFNLKTQPIILENLVSEIHTKNKLKGMPTRILEIGIGNGRVLMELKKKFPQIEFFGINKKKTRTFFRRESYADTALKFGLFTEKQLKHMNLPQVSFQDLDFGQKIPFQDEMFDLVYSQYTLMNIRYKFELLNDVLRVLKMGGVSLHSDLLNVPIYSNGAILELKDALALFRKNGLYVKSLREEGSIIFYKKNHDNGFNLSPQHSIPSHLDFISDELKKPQMGYHFNEAL